MVVVLRVLRLLPVLGAILKYFECYIAISMLYNILNSANMALTSWYGGVEVLGGISIDC